MFCSFFRGNLSVFYKLFFVLNVEIFHFYPFLFHSDVFCVSMSSVCVYFAFVVRNKFKL